MATPPSLLQKGADLGESATSGATGGREIRQAFFRDEF
jgi:hypothetical protein